MERKQEETQEEGINKFCNIEKRQGNNSFCHEEEGSQCNW